MNRFLALLLLLWPLATPAQEATPPTEELTAQEEEDVGFLANLIANNLSGVSRDVRVIGFRGALSSRATVRLLTVTDAQGVWLRMEDLTLDWDRSALFGGRIEVEELSAGHITILRVPVSEAVAPSPEASPFALPELPVSINIGTLNAARITLGAPLLGEEIDLSVTGSVALAGGEGTANIVAERLDGTVGRFVIDGAYSNTTRVLALNMDLTEEPAGIVARLLDLPGQPAVRLTLAGTAPIDDYAADLSIATDGVERIAGAFGLLTTPAPAGGVPGRDFRLDVQGDVTALIAPQYHDFFGEDVRLAVQGARDAAGALTLSQLEISALSVALSGSAEIAADGWPAHLSLSGRIGAPEGGPVLLPVAGAATYVQSATLELQFDGAEGEGWGASFVIEDFDQPGLFIPDLTLQGGGTITRAEPGMPGAFTADFDYAARGLQLDDPGLAEALGQTVSGVISLARADGPVRIDALTINGPGIAARAEGTIAGAAERFRVQSSIMLTADRLERFARLTGLDLQGAADLAIVSDIRPLDGTFDLALTGQTRELAFGIDALDPLTGGEGQILIGVSRDTTGTRIDQFEITTPALEATGNLRLTSAESEAVFDLRIPDVSLSLPDLRGAATLRGTAMRDAEGVIVAQVAAGLPGVSLDIDAMRDADGVLDGTVVADVRALRPFARAIGRDLDGSIAARIAGQSNADFTQFTLDVTGETQDLILDIAALDPLLAGRGVIAAGVTRTGPQSIQVDEFRITTDAVILDAAVAVQDGIGSAAFDLQLDNVARVAPDLRGPARLTGTADRDAAGVITLNLGATAPQASAQIAAQVAGPADGYAVQGEVNAQIADLAPFAALAGRDLRGGFDVTAAGSLFPDLSRFDLRLDGTTEGLALGITALDPLLAGSGQVAGRVVRSGEENLRVEDFTLRTDVLTASGAAEVTDGVGEASFDLALRDAAAVVPGMSGAVTLSGTARRDAAQVIALDLRASGPGATAEVTAQIASPVDAYEVQTSIVAQVADLSPYSGLAGRRLGGAVDATVTGSLLPSFATFDLSIAASARNIDPGNAPAATVLRGTGTLAARVRRVNNGVLRVEGLEAQFPNLSATASVETQNGATQARFEARLADVAILTPDFSGPATAQGTATLNAAGQWQVETAATGPGGTSADISGTFSPSGQLDMRIVGSAPLGLANGFIEPRRLDGVGDFDLTLRGPAAIGSLGGTVRIAGARLSAPTFALALADLGGTVTLSGGRAELALAGVSEAGGRIDVAGGIGLSAPNPADLRIGVSGLVLRDPALYETTASGELTVIGALTGGARIAGRIDLGVTELQVPSSSVSALGDLPVVQHLNPPAPVRLTLDRAGLTITGARAATGRTRGPAYALDITISAPQQVFIRGRGLDAELGGSLTLGGTTAQIVPVGEFELLRGRLSILQQRFELTEGSASLQGDFTPFIRLVAMTTARTGTEVSIIVEGPLVEPLVTFRSSPELPQDEVLAQLIFGRDLSAITPLQAIQLAAAVGTLAGRGGGGLIDGLREGFGVDDFDILADAEGNAALRIGKYLGENVYTDVTIGSESTEINLNLDLTDDIRATGSVGSDGETSLGIYFERDY